MSRAAALGPGTIALEITVDADHAGPGRVVDVRIASSRPVGATASILVGRPAAEVPELVGRLHALCGRSHAAAAALAIAAARGDDPRREAEVRFGGLLAERVGEHLRSVFLGPLGLPAGEAPPAAITDLRSAVAAAQALAGPIAASDRERRAEAIDRARRGVERLGIGLDRHHRLVLAPGSWAEAISLRAGETFRDAHGPADPLGPSDDAAALAALAADPVGFAAAPRLPRRRVETGPFARAVLRSGGGVFDGRGRLEARLAEIADALRLLAADEATRAAEIDHWIAVGRDDGTSGHAAIESPRGRLHHLVHLDGDGRVAALSILAPTEWNFAPDGPFVATVRAERVTPDEAGRARVVRLAAAFDPCVGFDVTVREAAHA